MGVLLWVAVLGAAFFGCRWGGRVLDRHYNDRSEIAAVLVVALCVFLPMALNSAAALVDDAVLKVSLGVAICAGLFTGRGPIAS